MTKQILWQITRLVRALNFRPDSAILYTFSPGSYTAIVSGVGNTTGVGLVEVYKLQ